MSLNIFIYKSHKLRLKRVGRALEKFGSTTLWSVSSSSFVHKLAHKIEKIGISLQRRQLVKLYQNFDVIPLFFYNGEGSYEGKFIELDKNTIMLFIDCLMEMEPCELEHVRDLNKDDMCHLAKFFNELYDTDFSKYVIEMYCC